MSLHYITLHCIALHYITLHYITLHYITSHYITLHHITSHYITLHHITSHRIASHRIASHRIAITSHHITSHNITLHYITLHYITLHYIKQITTRLIASFYIICIILQICWCHVQWRHQPQKSGGGWVWTMFLCWWAVKVTIYIHGIPLIICKTNFSTDQEGSEQKGADPPFLPRCEATGHICSIRNKLFISLQSWWCHFRYIYRLLQFISKFVVRKLLTLPGIELDRYAPYLLYVHMSSDSDVSRLATAMQW